MESRQRYDEMGRQARQRRCEMFMAKAEAALSKGCYREAAACFRRAQELAPDDADIAHKAAEAARLAGDK